MVGGSLRHLRSLRMLRYDGGRINTLLDESENERMHLLTFLEIAGRKGPFFRAAVVVAQGVMWNFFFLLYLASPNTGELGGESEIVTSPREMDDCAVIHKYHCAFLRRMGERARGRKASPFSLSSHFFFSTSTSSKKKKKKKKAHAFVGFLEEEAVKTYTHALAEIDAGRLWPVDGPVKPPAIAIAYWNLPTTATMRDVILAIRADEAAHAHVNHTFSLIDADAPNPFAVRSRDGEHGCSAATMAEAEVAAEEEEKEEEEEKKKEV